LGESGANGLYSTLKGILTTLYLAVPRARPPFNSETPLKILGIGVVRFVSLSTFVALLLFV
jgi:hypothetical protein